MWKNIKIQQFALFLLLLFYVSFLPGGLSVTDMVLMWSIGTLILQIVVSVQVILKSLSHILKVFPFSQGWCRQLLFQQAAGNLMDSIYLSKNTCTSLPGKADTAFSTNMDCLCVVLPLTPLQ